MTPAREVTLFLCGSLEDFQRFADHLREQRLDNEVRAVSDARDLVRLIDALPHSLRALVVLDASAEGAWEGYDALRSSHLKAVPVIAICAPEDSEPAYARGVNAVLPREHWEKYFARTAARLTSFWLRLVHVPGKTA